MRDVDGRGRSISTAHLYDVVETMRGLQPGGEVLLVAHVLPTVDSDVRAWCRVTGHELMEVEESHGERRYRLRKTAGLRAVPSWAVVISDPGLEEPLSPLGFALAAALSGSQVAIYFQGPAARVPTRGFREKLTGAHRAPFSGFARRGLAAPAMRLRTKSCGSFGSWARGCMSGALDGALQGEGGGSIVSRDQDRRVFHLRGGDGGGGRAGLPAVAVVTG